jgi:hypothetical protein
LNNGLNREEEKNLLFLLSSNFNLLEIEGMFNADLVLNKYLKANITNQPHPFNEFREKAIPLNEKTLELIKQVRDKE